MVIHRTAYLRVTDTLRERILSGAYDGGEQLPPERQLCEEFNTSRITVRRALQILEEESLVHRRQGSGTFVMPKPARKIPIVNMDFSGSVNSHAPDMERRMHLREWVGLDADIADALQAEPGERALHAVRIDALRGDPVAADQLWVPEALADELGDEELAAFDFLARWQRAQRIQLTHITQAIEAAPASAPFNAWLGVPRGTPILRETNIVLLAGTIPAGLIETHYRHDRFRFESRIELTAYPQLRLNR